MPVINHNTGTEYGARVLYLRTSRFGTIKGRRQSGAEHPVVQYRIDLDDGMTALAYGHEFIQALPVPPDDGDGPRAA